MSAKINKGSLTSRNAPGRYEPASGGTALNITNGDIKRKVIHLYTYWPKSIKDRVNARAELNKRLSEVSQQASNLNSSSTSISQKPRVSDATAELWADRFRAGADLHLSCVHENYSEHYKRAFKALPWSDRHRLIKAHRHGDEDIARARYFLQDVEESWRQSRRTSNSESGKSEPSRGTDLETVQQTLSTKDPPSTDLDPDPIEYKSIKKDSAERKSILAKHSPSMTDLMKSALSPQVSPSVALQRRVRDKQDGLLSLGKRPLSQEGESPLKRQKVNGSGAQSQPSIFSNTSVDQLGSPTKAENSAIRRLKGMTSPFRQHLRIPDARDSPIGSSSPSKHDTGLSSEVDVLLEHVSSDLQDAFDIEVLQHDFFTSV